MAGVFISYRREDSPGHAGRIFDRVRARFGADAVFMDVTAIDAGVDFVDAIDRAVGTCDVLLAVIGPHWAGATDSAGRKRLDNPNDFIRLEIGGALKRNVRVVPVLVDDAQLPGTADLPDDLQPLLRRNASELRDARWDADIEQLVASLERIVTRSEEPLRLEAPPRGRWRWVAALTVLVLGAVAWFVWGPRPRAPEPEINVATTTAPPAKPTPDPAKPNPDRATPPAPRPEPPLPDVVGKSLADARETLRRAGVDVSRVFYRDDRTKAIDVVLARSAASTTTGTPAVVLTAVARASIIIQHSADDRAVARRLMGVLTSSRPMDGVVLRTIEMPAPRAESIARVNYSDRALAGMAGDVAKDANAWLAQNEPGRPALVAALHPPVVERTIVIGLPDRTTSPSGLPPIPDVRGLILSEARSKLHDAGFDDLSVKWADASRRKPSEVIEQAEGVGRTGKRSVILDVNARGTLVLFHVAADLRVAERLASDLRKNLTPRGVFVRLVEQPTGDREWVGRVVSSRSLAGDAVSIATWISSWLTKERGRTVTIPSATQVMEPQHILFGLPSIR